MSGLFGDVDAAEVPNDPFYVAPDTYYCKLVEANKVEKKEEKGGGYGLAFKWQIDEPDSPYNGNHIQDWKNIYPDVSASEMTADIRKDNSRLKGRLLQMGVPESEMNDLLDNLDSLIGLEAYVTVVESTDKHDPEKKYTNINKIRVED